MASDLASQLVRDAAAALRTDDMDASAPAIIRAYAELGAAVEADLRHQVKIAIDLGYHSEAIIAALRIGAARGRG